MIASEKKMDIVDAEGERGSSKRARIGIDVATEC